MAYMPFIIGKYEQSPFIKGFSILNSFSFLTSLIVTLNTFLDAKHSTIYSMDLKLDFWMLGLPTKWRMKKGEDDDNEEFLHFQGLRAEANSS